MDENAYLHEKLGNDLYMMHDKKETKRIVYLIKIISQKQDLFKDVTEKTKLLTKNHKNPPIANILSLLAGISDKNERDNVFSYTMEFSHFCNTSDMLDIFIMFKKMKKEKREFATRIIKNIIPFNNTPFKTLLDCIFYTDDNKIEYIEQKIYLLNNEYKQKYNVVDIIATLSRLFKCRKISEIDIYMNMTISIITKYSSNDPCKILNSLANLTIAQSKQIFTQTEEFVSMSNNNDIESIISALGNINSKTYARVISITKEILNKNKSVDILTILLLVDHVLNSFLSEGEMTRTIKILPSIMKKCAKINIGDINEIVNIATIYKDKCFILIDASQRINELYPNIEKKDIIIFLRKNIHIADISFAIDNIILFIKNADIFGLDIVIDILKKIFSTYDGKKIIHEINETKRICRELNIIEFTNTILSYPVKNGKYDIISKLNKLINQCQSQTSNDIYQMIKYVAYHQIGTIRDNYVKEVYRYTLLNNVSPCNACNIIYTRNKHQNNSEVHAEASIYLQTTFEKMELEIKQHIENGGTFQINTHDIMEYINADHVNDVDDVNEDNDEEDQYTNIYADILTEYKIHIHSMIDGIIEENIPDFIPETEENTSGILSLYNIRDILHNFIEHEKFQNIMPIKWKNLGKKVTGMTFLDTTMKYISIHPELKIAFLVQGLWDSVTAYVDNPQNLDSISCVRGIAERLIIWNRDENEEIELLEEVRHYMYEHKMYERLYYFDDEENMEYIKQNFGNAKDATDFREKISIAIAQLHNFFKKELEKKYKKSLTKLFKRKEIMYFFFPFDDMELNNKRFEEAYNETKTM